MSRRTKIAGTRPIVTWLLVIIMLVLVVGLGAGVFIVYPQYQERQAAQATVEQVVTHYQAGVAFQSVGDWEKAAREYEQVIRARPNHKDAQARLGEMKAKQAEDQAQATAAAVARVTEVAVQTRATAQAQATAVTQVAGATATADAVEAHYQKGLAYINLGKWDEAKAELEQVFTADPNYKEVQAKLTEVEAQLEGMRTLTPTVTPVPLTPTPRLVTPTPAVCALLFRGLDQNDGSVHDEYSLQVNDGVPISFDELTHASSEGDRLADWEQYAFPIEVRPGQENVIVISVTSGGKSMLRFDYVRLQQSDVII